MSTELVLQKAAEDGSLDSEEWPRTLDYILTRLDEIVNSFPKPTIPISDRAPSSPNVHTPTRPQNLSSSQESQTADKENAPPATPPRPPVPAFPGSPSASQSELLPLPEETFDFYTSIRNTLSKNFAKDPPHTIQRLAELILQPKRQFRFLSSYLRALDRVVSVSSPSTIFPLPIAVLPNSGGLLNGTTSTPQNTLGSDESLGGALLTPIPWLQNRGQSELISESTEMVDGPHGAGRIETVSVMNGSGAVPAPQITSSHPEGESLPSTGAVTQGEIIRQEQQAGVVLSNPHSMTSSRTTVGEMEDGEPIVDTVEDEEVPHARGPEMIGMEDTGPQAPAHEGLDFEAAIGRSSQRSSKSPGPAEGKKDEEVKDEGEKEQPETETKEGDAKGEDAMKTD
ncbi:hypothetical protein CC78DRAFT_621796 [Lojkania enalia]|uniref:Protein phosphatase 4 core regulatory subunit R2 n=1 Tax=Lojkania enalia TaxID=147567 RepID=A0A9P4K0H0_9PLEO|nr:hypothetical protein CC78DRAFT_621796 [Didymosphaeria enalia]